MNDNYSIKILSQKDLVNAGCMNMEDIIQICEKALLEYTKGRMIFPSKVSVIFDEKSQSRINCLPAAILRDQVYGMKWVSVFPDNPHLHNKPNLSAVVILSELETGYPKALLEGSMITSFRTAAVGAIAAKYLAKRDSKTIGIIGAGEIGKAHLLAMKSVLPELKVCKVASRTKNSEEKFIYQMKKICPDIDFISCNTICKEAAIDADVIVTAISGQEKLLQSEWIKNGAFYCHAAGLEDDFSVAKKASKIVCDDWEVVKHRTQTISQMYQLGLLYDEDIYANLYELIDGSKIGRENDQEFIYFNSVGLSYIDVMIADWMYNCAKNKGIGYDFEMKDKSIFD